MDVNGGRDRADDADDLGRGEGEQGSRSRRVVSDEDPAKTIGRPDVAGEAGPGHAPTAQVVLDLLAPFGHPRPLTCAIACSSLRNSAAVRGAWRDER